MHALRLVMVTVVILAASLAPKLAGASTRYLLPVAATYVAVEVGLEIARRRNPVGGFSVLAAMLLGDAVFIVTVMYRTGGASSYLSFLVELHLIAVSLLVSYRTGLKLAFSYTVLFAVGHYLHAVGWLATAQGGRAVVVGFGTSEVFGILAFWLVALGTAAFSSLNERELRRSKVELRALATMSAALTSNPRPDLVPGLVLDSLLTTFGMTRGAMVIAGPDGAETTTMVGRDVTRTVDGLESWPDAVAEVAAARRAPVLVRTLGPDSPVLADAMPRSRNVIVLPLLAGSEMLGVVAMQRRGRDPLGVPARALELMGQFAAHGALALRNASLLAEVQRLAKTDGLTGLANRRVFEEALDREVARAARHGSPLSVILFDVDHFKSVNDRQGHQAGDEVLRSIGRALQASARAADVAARFGGEEFVMLLPDCATDNAALVAERIRATVAASAAGVTVSAGVASRAGAGIDRSELVRAADQALYQAKAAGRDRTIVWDKAASGRSRPLRARGDRQRRPA
jgi:diguanylate cyclase (GGDEF)-like protein